MSNLKKKIISTGNTIIDKKLEEEYLKDLAEIHKANLQLKRKKKKLPNRVRERRKGWIEELDAILFDDIPYWYKTYFDQDLFFVRLQYLFDNFEPILSFWVCNAFFCAATGSVYGLWVMCEHLGLTENFFFRSFLFFLLLAWWFTYLTEAILDYFLGLQRQVGWATEDYLEELELQRRRMRIKPKYFSVSSYYPEFWLEELENEDDMWLEERD